MKYTVRKGLESPCTIRGMLARDYWVFMGLCALLALMGFMGLRSGISSGNWQLLLLCLVGAPVLLPTVYIKLRRKARSKKFDISKTETSLSNLPLRRLLANLQKEERHGPDNEKQ